MVGQAAYHLPDLHGIGLGTVGVCSVRCFHSLHPVVHLIFGVHEHTIQQMGKLNTEFDLGQLVYLKTDVEQHERIVTGIIFDLGGSYIYELSLGTDVSRHYEGEITAECDTLKKIQ